MLDEIQWGDLWIAQATDQVIQFDLVPSRAAEVVPLIGGANSKVSDRGNNTNTLTLGVLREHSSVSASRSFILSHAKTIQAMSQLTARSLVLRYKAFPITVYTIARAVPISFPGKQKGVTSIHTYTFVGESIS